MVNWTTRKRLPREDGSCILNRLDHPAITVESVVHYRGAVLCPTSSLQARLDSGVFAISDVLLGEDAYKRLLQGFQVTQHVPFAVYDFLDDQGFLPSVS